MMTTEAKAARRAMKKAVREAVLAKGNPFKVGQLFVNSWGYEQTNVDYYEAIKVGPRSVTLRPIASHPVPCTEYSHGMAQRVGPSPGEFTGPAFTKSLQVWVCPLTGKHGDPGLSARHGCMTPINPEDTNYESWYG